MSEAQTADPIPEAPADEEVEGLAQALRNLAEGAEQEDRTILYKAAAALRRSTATDKPGVREAALEEAALCRGVRQGRRSRRVRPLRRTTVQPTCPAGSVAACALGLAQVICAPPPFHHGRREVSDQLSETVRCGDCKYFVRDGKCGFLATPEGRDKSRPFSHAPFWVWSDCYSDREQVRAAATSRCSTFAQRQESPNV